MDSKKKSNVRVSEDYVDRWSRLIWNNDLLTEIFVLLPPKSVARCKLVCKQWLSLISSHQFCHLHTLRCPNLRLSFILDPDVINDKFYIIDPIMNREKLMPYTFTVPEHILLMCSIKISCNGLMLIPSFRDYPFKSFLVYNPTTKLSRDVSVTNANSVVAFALAFDPSKSPHYKVVVITSTTHFCTNPHEIHTYQIEVYESEIHAWKLRLGPFTFPKQLDECGECWGAGVYCNGSIYWEMCDNIVHYDIAQNEFNTFSMPDYQSYEAGKLISGSISCLQEANGRLYKSRYLRRDDSLSIEVFELEMNDDRSSSWLLRYEGTISLHELSLPFQLRFIKGSYDTEMCSVVFNIYGKIIAYSFLDNSYYLLVDMNRHPIPISFGSYNSRFKMYEFIECLAVV